MNKEGVCFHFTECSWSESRHLAAARCVGDRCAQHPQLAPHVSLHRRVHAARLGQVQGFRAGVTTTPHLRRSRGCNALPCEHCRSVICKGQLQCRKEKALDRQSR